MDLVFIYGPPGVGKLTVAKELARLTGYKLFDNHVSIDWQSQVFGFDFGSPAHASVVDRLRQVVLEEAARHKVSLIFTFVYAHEVDQDTVEWKSRAVEQHGGRVCLVQLLCRHEALMTRVESAGRQEAGKVADASRLLGLLASHDLFTPIPNRDSLRIDNTDLAPDVVARQIAAHYALPLLAG